MAWIKKPTWRLAAVYLLLAFLILGADRPTTLSLSIGLPLIIVGETTWFKGGFVFKKGEHGTAMSMRSRRIVMVRSGYAATASRPV